MSYNSIYRRDLFRDRIVVITGGGSGIGRCTAHELASLGAHVAIVGRNEAKLERVRCEIESDGGSISAHVADIRDEHAVIATVERVLTDHGRIDGGAPNARRGWWDLQPAKNNVALDGFHRSSIPAILNEVP